MKTEYPVQYQFGLFVELPVSLSCWQLMAVVLNINLFCSAMVDYLNKNVISLMKLLFFFITQNKLRVIYDSEGI